MKKEDLFFLQSLLKKIKNPDARVARAIAIVDRDIAIYNERLERLTRHAAEYDIFP